MADCVVVATEWKEFSTFDYNNIVNIVNQKNIVDCRNCINREVVEKIGFKYIGF